MKGDGGLVSTQVAARPPRIMGLRAAPVGQLPLVAPLLAVIGRSSRQALKGTGRWDPFPELNRSEGQGWIKTPLIDPLSDFRRQGEG